MHSPLSASALLAGGIAALTATHATRQRVARDVAARYGARRALLTDSGTSALVLALRALAGDGSTVALPAYGCIDLTAAACAARVRVRLYDVDPRTLAPDEHSLIAALERGVSAVVVAHLYGHPVDVPAVVALAARWGVPVIEDAAQSAGASIDGRHLGAFGALAVLSFGRGKGIAAGGGGALLVHDDTVPGVGDLVRLASDESARGWRALAASAAQAALGRPALYGIPSAIPMLRLGEMVYRPPHAPRAMSAASLGMLPFALESADAAGAARRAVGERLAAAARAAGLHVPSTHVHARAGMLRCVVVDPRGRLEPAPSHGVLRGYPLMLSEHTPLRAALARGEEEERRYPGARELRDALFTLPTHRFVTPSDEAWMARWMRGAQTPSPRAAVAAALS